MTDFEKNTIKGIIEKLNEQIDQVTEPKEKARLMGKRAYFLDRLNKRHQAFIAYRAAEKLDPNNVMVKRGMAEHAVL